MEFNTITEDQLEKVVSYLQSVINQKKIWILIGDLGSGKTTLVKKLLESIGNQQDVVSPTFGLVNEYSNAQQNIVHMDLYRLLKAEEAFDIGLDEYLNNGNLCFIEWPELILPYLKNYDFGVIKITHVKEGRNYHIEL